MYLTSTNPQVTRLYMLNTDDTKKIVLSVHYFMPNRIDVYRNGFIDPSNGARDSNSKF